MQKSFKATWLAVKTAPGGLPATKSAFADRVEASVRPQPAQAGFAVPPLPWGWRNAHRRGFNRQRTFT
jgi:hypothetical protein